MEKGQSKQSRRKFFAKTVPAVIGTIGGAGLIAQSCKQSVNNEETVALLSPDGQVVQVAKSAMTPVSPVEARKGIEGKHFVMVVDLVAAEMRENV